MSPLSFLHTQHLCYSMLENGDCLRDVDVIMSLAFVYNSVNTSGIKYCPMVGWSNVLR